MPSIISKRVLFCGRPRLAWSIALCLAVSWVGSCGAVCAQEATVETIASKAEVVEGTVKAAKAFLESLEQKQYEKVVYSFTDDKQRESWSNLPVARVPRGGVRWGDLNETQKEAAMTLLKSMLSEYGVQQIVDNMNGDEYLKQNSKRASSFGSDEYFISFLGEPSLTSAWMLQFGGHHLGINLTVVGEEMTCSPSLTGGQPIDYPWEGEQIRQVAEEEDAAYALIGSMSETQLKKAVTADKYQNLRFGPGATKIEPAEEGICVSDLDKSQKELLRVLIESRLGILNATHGAAAMEEILADFPKTWFSWQGPLEAGGNASFLIQSPAIVMEYCPQRLGGVPTNHIHAMYRDPSNDYGLGFIEAQREKLNKAQGISGSAISPEPNQ